MDPSQADGEGDEEDSTNDVLLGDPSRRRRLRRRWTSAT
jgi:hypothetical protein